MSKLSIGDIFLEIVEFRDDTRLVVFRLCFVVLFLWKIKDSFKVKFFGWKLGVVVVIYGFVGIYDVRKIVEKIWKVFREEIFEFDILLRDGLWVEE